MTTTERKQRVIPKVAWFLACFLAIVFGTLIFEFALGDPEFSHWPEPGRIALAYGGALLGAAYVLLIVYICRDAKRRGMRYVMWTLLAIFIPDAIGIILYFILRGPLPVSCPSCARSVKASFAFCPFCSASLQPTCPQCGFAVDRAWLHCPKCGTKLPTPAPHQTVSPAAPRSSF
ncbi:MAG TPA: zinc ribbon domain-containing protein [Candidatus Acidoferrales bacterium]|nr:zinc ribbon domain-containing protein [Candidatus Acidoferrales bacterium]